MELFFVEFDSELLEHGFNFFEKTAIPVMFFLIFNVSADFIDGGGTDGEGGVAFLPCEFRYACRFVHPF